MERFPDDEVVSERGCMKTALLVVTVEHEFLNKRENIADIFSGFLVESLRLLVFVI